MGPLLQQSSHQADSCNFFSPHALLVESRPGMRTTWPDGAMPLKVCIRKYVPGTVCLQVKPTQTKGIWYAWSIIPLSKWLITMVSVRPLNGS